LVLNDGTALELEVNPAAEPEELLLTLNIKRADNTVTSTMIMQDRKLHLVIYLERKNMAERVLYKSLIALPMPLGPLLVPAASVPAGQGSDHAPDHKG
jgi:hypothetical protein